MDSKVSLISDAYKPKLFFRVLVVCSIFCRFRTFIFFFIVNTAISRTVIVATPATIPKISANVLLFLDKNYLTDVPPTTDFKSSFDNISSLIVLFLSFIFAMIISPSFFIFLSFNSYFNIF